MSHTPLASKRCPIVSYVVLRSNRKPTASSSFLWFFYFHFLFDLKRLSDTSSASTISGTYNKYSSHTREYQ